MPWLVAWCAGIASVAPESVSGSSAGGAALTTGSAGFTIAGTMRVLGASPSAASVAASGCTAG